MAYNSKHRNNVIDRPSKKVSFNSRNSARIVASEIDPDPNDYEVQQGGLDSSDSGSGVANGGEIVESKDKKPCPECDGYSIVNNPETPMYFGDCASCTGKDCEDYGTSEEPHCGGCKSKETNCPGRDKAHWRGEGTVCHICNNTGEVDAEPYHCLTCKGDDCSGPDHENKGHCYGCKDKNDELPKEYHRASSHYYKLNATTEGSPEEDDDDLFGSMEIDDDDRFGDEVKYIKPKTNEESIRGISPSSAGNPELLGKFEDPDELAEATEKWSPQIKKPKADIRYIDSELPEPKYVERHNPWCSKCKGTGIISNREDIARINNSDEFKNGIKKIKEESKAAGYAPGKLLDKQNDFILQQYKCNGE